MEADQILPLLDGLDEVAIKERTACIEAINTYRQEHGLLPLVVCSRSADYLAQTARVQLGTAVMVQPLSPKQVEAYLRSAGPQVEALSIAVHHDSDLQRLSATPLMLSILARPTKELLSTRLPPSAPFQPSNNRCSRFMCSACSPVEVQPKIHTTANYTLALLVSKTISTTSSNRVLP